MSKSSRPVTFSSIASHDGSHADLVEDFKVEQLVTSWSLVKLSAFQFVFANAAMGVGYTDVERAADAAGRECKRRSCASPFSGILGARSAGDDGVMCGGRPYSPPAIAAVAEQSGGAGLTRRGGSMGASSC